MRRLLVLLLLLTGCFSPPPPPPPKKERPIRVGRAVLGAFSAYLYVGYDAILARNHPKLAAQAKIDLKKLPERQALAREELRQALREAGAPPARLETAEGLLELIQDGVKRGGRYAFVFPLGDRDSFSIMRVRERASPRAIRLFGKPFAYKLTVYDETLVWDYPSYAARRLGRPAPRETATYGAGGVVRVDRAAAEWVGAKLFLPRVEQLRASARVAAGVKAFLARQSRLRELLVLTKDALRWRSLEQLWSLIGNRSRDEQLRRFAEDYASRAELRAAAELREVSRLKADPKKALTPDQQVLLFELGTLSAAIHGDPLGQMADILALAAVSLKPARHEPHFRAARQLVLEVVAKLRKGKPGNEADARALARLARASPDLLRRLAKALYLKRTR